MKKISFVCLQKEFIQDLEVQFIINSMSTDYELRGFDSVEAMEENIPSYSPDLIVLSCDALFTRDKWEYDNIEVAYHAKNSDDFEEAKKYGLKTIGIAGTTKELIDKLGKEPVPADSIKSEKNQKQERKSAPKNTAPAETEDPEEEDTLDMIQTVPTAQQKKKNSSKNRDKRSAEKEQKEHSDDNRDASKSFDSSYGDYEEEDDDIFGGIAGKRLESEKDEDETVSRQEKQPSKNKKDRAGRNDGYDDSPRRNRYDDDAERDRYDDDDDEDEREQSRRPKKSRRYDERDERRRRSDDYDDYDDYDDEEEYRHNRRRRHSDEEDGGNRRNRYDNDRYSRRNDDDMYDERDDDDDYDDRRRSGKRRKQKPADEGKSKNSSPKYEVRDRRKKGDAIDEEIKKDMNTGDGKPKVISVYSAKGGVGKTKISSELALYLAMVSNGRRDLRVCLVDCNIDFGDVRATLHMGAKGPNMGYWADEIRELRENGNEDIVYSKEEIEKWLRHDPDSGLYVLPAPLTNMDSMDVDSEDIRIIFDNLINNGEFDFIVCDTGNNTRDSTMIALEKSNYILMLMVQDINTANCNLAFIGTMNSIDFDTSKIKLVINKIKPEKATSVSIQDIEDCFKDYECIGKIRYNQDVEVSSNEGKPLAFKGDHEFIKQMKSIVAYVLNDESFNEEPEKKKKKLFGLFGKKKK